MKEIWKSIEMFDLYRVSSHGRIKRVVGFYRKKEKMLKPRNSFGYLRVNLSQNGSSKWFRVHRLVAEAFILNPESKPCVNHKNGIKHDNRATNLEWVTCQENTKHGREILKTIKLGPGKQRIICLNNGEIYGSHSAAAKMLGLSQTSVSAVCRGKLESTKGYKFKKL